MQSSRSSSHSSVLPDVLISLLYLSKTASVSSIYWSCLVALHGNLKESNQPLILSPIVIRGNCWFCVPKIRVLVSGACAGHRLGHQGHPNFA